MSLSEDTGIKQSFCPNSLYKKYIISRILDTVAFLDFLIQWLFQDSVTLSRSVWKRSAKQTQRASMQIASWIKNVGFVGVEVYSPTWSLFAKMWPLTNTQSFSFHLIMPYLLARPELFTRDDIVSQRLKFGSTFLSSSWESKIALFFLTFPYPEPVPKKLCDFYWLQLRITCKSGWIAQAEKRYCVSKEGKSKITA